MKVSSSIKTLKNRHPDCQVVRRKGRVYVIDGEKYTKLDSVEVGSEPYGLAWRPL